MNTAVLNKNKNWLLVMAGISLCLGFFFLILLGDNKYYGQRNYSDQPFGLILLATLLVAPIVEELVFRGFFAKNILLRRIAYFGLPLFLLIQSVNSLKISLLILFGVAYFLQHTYKKKTLSNITLLLNILLFTVVHYSLEELISQEHLYLPLFQLTGGFILVWITVNYSLVKAILFHFLWNSILMTVLFISIEFPDETLYNYSNDQVVVEWSRISKSASASSTIKFSTIEFEEQHIRAHNIEARSLYKLISDSLDKKSRILQHEPYMRYNVEITPKEIGTEKILEENLQQFLEKELIYVLPRE